MHAEDAIAANRLLALSLDRSSLPGTDAEHQQLIVRFRTDPGYASTVRQIAEPLGLRVLGANQQLGLVLDPLVASPFSLRLSDLAEKFRWTSANERIIYGVAVVGVATFCYPTAESFKEPGVRQLTAVDVDKWIRQAAVSLQDRDDHSGRDIAPAEALEIYVAEKAVSRGGTKLRRDCTVYKIGTCPRMARRPRLPRSGQAEQGISSGPTSVSDCMCERSQRMQHLRRYVTQ